MAGVELEEVRKVYAGNVEAVKGVSLDIPDGSFCVLVGPSGCGKSTLLRMVAGLETISGGTVRIGERVVNQIEPSERDIAMVFQNYALYPHMSVYDNMAYGLRNRRTPKDEIDKRVREAARILAIEPFLDRRPRQLSGGQRQRVAMGRAIVRKPQVFLFDEPLSNLDAKLRVQMRVEIKRLQRALGVTSIYVTHDQVEAMTLSDKLVVMSGGQIEQVGTPGEVYRRPETRFVATFIGSPPMNILPGKALRAEPRRSRRPDADRVGHARRACRRHAGRGRPEAGGCPRWPRRRSNARHGRRLRRGTRRDPALPRQARRRRLRRPGADGRSPRRRPPLSLSIDPGTCTSSIRRRRSGSGGEAETPVRQEFRCPPCPTRSAASAIPSACAAAKARRPEAGHDGCCVRRRSGSGGEAETPVIPGPRSGARNPLPDAGRNGRGAWAIGVGVYGFRARALAHPGMTADVAP